MSVVTIESDTSGQILEQVQLSLRDDDAQRPWLYLAREGALPLTADGAEAIQRNPRRYYFSAALRVHLECVRRHGPTG